MRFAVDGGIKKFFVAVFSQQKFDCITAKPAVSVVKDYGHCGFSCIHLWFISNCETLSGHHRPAQVGQPA